MVIFGSTKENLRENVNIITRHLKGITLKCNTERTKTMIMGTESLTHNVEIEGQDIEQVGMFKYPGGIINSRGTLKDEINERIAKTGQLYRVIKTSFLSKIEIPQEVKAEVVRRVAKPISVHSCESWTTNESRRRKMNNTETRFLRRIKIKLDWIE